MALSTGSMMGLLKELRLANLTERQTVHSKELQKVEKKEIHSERLMGFSRVLC
jgi:hypothetical protein